jgi:3-dehydro-4-phosphotetronate decarboxylase
VKGGITLGSRIDSHRAAVVQAGRQLCELGLSTGSAGNLSVRESGHILISPTGVPLDAMTTDLLSVLDLNGRLVEGPPPSKEVPLHVAFYGRAEAPAAVAHVHSPYATAHSCLAPWSETSALPPITPYLIMRVGHVPLIPYANPGDQAQAQTVHGYPQPINAVLLANHGPITAGATLGQAIERLVEIEQAARLCALTHGREPRHLSPAVVAELLERARSHGRLPPRQDERQAERRTETFPILPHKQAPARLHAPPAGA